MQFKGAKEGFIYPAYAVVSMGREAEWPRSFVGEVHEGLGRTRVALLSAHVFNIGGAEYVAIDAGKGGGHGAQATTYAYLLPEWAREENRVYFVARGYVKAILKDGRDEDRKSVCDKLEEEI